MIDIGVCALLFTTNDILLLIAISMLSHTYFSVIKLYHEICLAVAFSNCNMECCVKLNL